MPEAIVMAKLADALGAYLRLTRFEHAIMLAAAVAIGEAVWLKRIPAFGLAFVAALLVPVLNEMASFALNDLLDIKADRENKRLDRPLVAGELPKSVAVATVAIGYIASNLIAYTISQTAFVIVLVFSVLSILYNFKLKDIALVGNAYIAASMAVPFYFGAVAVGAGADPGQVIMALLVVAFVAGLGREIAKTVQDVEGDVKARGSKTIAVVIGKKGAAMASSLLYIAVIPLSYLPFVAGLNPNPAALGFVTMANLVFAYLAIQNAMHYSSRQFLKTAQNLSLMALGLGLLGITLGAI